MGDGLHVLVMPFGYYYAAIMVGWMRAGDGLEIQVHDGRILDFPRGAVPAEDLAVRGLHGGVTLRRAIPLRTLWRPHILFAIPANKTAWAKDCPCPATWRAEVAAD